MRNAGRAVDGGATHSGCMTFSFGVFHGGAVLTYTDAGKNRKSSGLIAADGHGIVKNPSACSRLFKGTNSAIACAGGG